ncbi:MAG: hypothetical protein Q4G02_04380 [bacterium]|nr:hypothetical protein [bacterium]
MLSTRRKSYYHYQRSWNVSYYAKLIIFALVLLIIGGAGGWFGHAYRNQLQKQQLLILSGDQFEKEIRPNLGSRLQSFHGPGMDWQKLSGTNIDVYSTLDDRQLVLISWSNDRQRHTVMYLPFSYKEYGQMFTAK